MKKIKVVFALLPLVVISLFIYSSSNAFLSGENGKLSVPYKDGVSTNCSVNIRLSTTGNRSCLTGSYTYCINGGTAVSVSTEAFSVSMPCGTTSTICVMSSNGCIGTASIYVPCPCTETGDETVITLANTGAACLCAPGS